MENYEKKYKEVLERAKTLYENANGMILKKWVEQVFPELAESEDERISREITEFILTHRIDEPNDIEDTNSWLAWLEKQGKEECTLKSSKDEDVRKFMEYIEKEAKAYDFNLPNRSYDIYAFAKDILVWLEKQSPKLKWTEEDEICSDETIELLEYFNNYAPEFRRPAIGRSIAWLKSIKKAREE